jgi:hypothetical protein
MVTPMRIIVGGVEHVAGGGGGRALAKHATCRDVGRSLLNLGL